MDLIVKDIDLSIGDKQIIKNISMDCKDGKFIGLIGPNGSGKSTLLKSIYKVLKPNQGEIYLGEKDVLKESYKEIFKDMSVVGQFNNMEFDFTVFEIVMMGRTPHKKFLEDDNDLDKKIVLNALKEVDLLSYKDRSYMTLSGGEKQRVVLARAIAQEPKFLVLDEPTNHLDIKNKLELFKILKSLNIGILAALHDLNMAIENCDILYILKDGEIVDKGTPDKVIRKETLDKVYEVNSEIYKSPVDGKLKVCFS